MFVLDNSVSMRWFLKQGPAHAVDYALGVLEAIKTTAVVVPGIWGLEVANTLARSEKQGATSEAESEAFVERLSALTIAVDTETSAQALGGSLRLARRYRISAYDAAYLELALRKDLPLASLDEELLKAAKRAGVRKFEAKAGP